jgi:superfamily I DNA and/or RNA helicase
MASPSTVAQIFPRQPLFEVMVFDEASQCRLEEALPVLTRGQRVVIAGDPKQLPPTRFFESAIADAEPEEAETDQELFEQQQAETEDLLTAALNLDVRQCYLDVHYRSRNDGLIEFSNRSFYDRRLQAIPGHPMNRPQASPIRLIRADGVYLKRGNAKEAQAVCDLVRELLNRPEPPSIGVACFNLTQRDLILDRLEELAEQDPDFARKLEQARARRGAASFEGLFVKNLENVQGDERDHIIISTTFGPDPQGKFRRNFGPVGKSGGGRRLNVLVTRAREMIHVITSIPRSEYAALPPVTAGQTPGGRWLLYAYLQFIEELEQRLPITFSATMPRPPLPKCAPRTRRIARRLRSAWPGNWPRMGDSAPRCRGATPAFASTSPCNTRTGPAT